MEEVEKNRQISLSLCDRLLALIEENREDAHAFFGGEVHSAYVKANDKAKSKTRSIKNQIRNL